jgi:hypothetical protein
MNDKTLQRYSDLLLGRNEKFIVIDNKIFKPYNRMAVPFGPVKMDFSISGSQAKSISQKLKCPIVRWTNGFQDEGSTNGWYAVICKEFVPLEKLKSKFRSEINRGLNNCTVKRIDAEFLSEHGYEVYHKALGNYRNKTFSGISKETFFKNFLINKNFDDIIHYWGVFNNLKLIAYGYNYIFENVESAYITAKFDPEYLRLYSSYALFYEMNKYYLSDNNFEYVNDGFRSILHETNIQEYLIGKFNFQKEYTNLNVYYSSLLKTFIKVTFPVKNLFTKYDRRFSALFELEKIRRISHG